MSIELGPFLCKPTVNSMSFWVLMKDNAPGIRVEIEILEDNKPICRTELETIKNSVFGVKMGASKAKLKAGFKYTYKVFTDGNLAELNGLSTEDLWFRTLPVEHDDISFSLVSCNGVDEYNRTKVDGQPRDFHMWDLLSDEVKSESPVGFGILAGDQVYMDKDFDDIMAAVKGDDFRKANQIIRAVYLRFWGDSSYQKTMAQMPCLLMWDDHDLIDGFGSRRDQFDKDNNETEHWKKYRDVLKVAFFEFQAVRNPGSAAVDSKNFSFSFSWGDIGFLGMDLRSDRNAFKKRLFSDEHRGQVGRAVSEMTSSNVKHLFFVTPVTIARMGEGLEIILGEIANYLWGSVRLFGWGETFLSRGLRVLTWTMFFCFSLVLLHLPLAGNEAFLPAVLCFFMGLLIVIADVNRARLETRNGKALEFCKILSGKIPKKDVPFRAYLRIVSILVSAVGLLVGAGALLFNHKEIIPQLWPIDFFQKEMNPIWGMVIYIAASSLLGAYITTAKSPCKLKGILSKICLFSPVILLTWLGLPGKEIGFYVLMQFIAQILVIFYMFMAMLEGWGIISEISGLDDDIKDAWSAPENKDELKWLYKLVGGLHKSGRRAYVLSGDIHTGGLTKIFVGKDVKNPLYQIVSSPIAYPPMPGFVERVTGSDKPVKFELGEMGEVEGINYFYNSSRNFVIVRSKNIEGSRRFRVEFTFENLKNKIIQALDI